MGKKEGDRKEGREGERKREREGEKIKRGKKEGAGVAGVEGKKIK